MVFKTTPVISDFRGVNSVELDSQTIQIHGQAELCNSQRLRYYIYLSGLYLLSKEPSEIMYKYKCTY